MEMALKVGQLKPGVFTEHVIQLNKPKFQVTD